MMKIDKAFLKEVENGDTRDLTQDEDSNLNLRCWEWLSDQLTEPQREHCFANITWGHYSVRQAVIALSVIAEVGTEDDE